MGGLLNEGSSRKSGEEIHVGDDRVICVLVRWVVAAGLKVRFEGLFILPAVVLRPAIHQGQSDPGVIDVIATRIRRKSVTQ